MVNQAVKIRSSLLDYDKDWSIATIRKLVHQHDAGVGVNELKLVTGVNYNKTRGLKDKWTKYYPRIYNLIIGIFENLRKDLKIEVKRRLVQLIKQEQGHNFNKIIKT